MTRSENLPTKTCERCGAEFGKPYKYSKSQWESARFCGRSCGTWNKGLTKNDDQRMMRIAECASESSKGRTAWNKGLTKYDDPRVLSISKNVSEAQIGKKPNEAQLRGLEYGRQWCAGKTAKDDERLAQMGRSLSESQKGKPKPEHSVRMKEFYRKNPHKHPNSIVATKSKGNGYTYIEQRTAAYLEDLGIGYEFNKRVGSKWADFALLGHGLIVESDGAYWHQDEEAERKRDAYLEDMGWRVLHLTGSEIVSDAEKCKTKIVRALASLEPA